MTTDATPMNEKKQLNKLIPLALGILLLILIFFAVKVSTRKSVSFDLKGATSSVPTQSTFTVDVYLDKKEDAEVTAYDVQIDYDKTKAKLVSAESGGYLTSPLLIKWDVDSGWFAASANPTSYKDSLQRTNPEEPLITLTFMALDQTNSSAISIKDGSEVYVAQKGGVVPSKAKFNFSVK